MAAWLRGGAWLCLGLLALEEVLKLIGKVGGDVIGRDLLFLSFYPAMEGEAPFLNHFVNTAGLGETRHG